MPSRSFRPRSPGAVASVAFAITSNAGADRRQVVPALGRERDGPRRAAKQLYAKGGLQRLHMLADGAGGDAQSSSAASLEAHVARGGFEGAQAVQGGSR